MRISKPSAPPILYGAYALAGLSLAWSGYAITDLMNSGKFGLSVALAGDIGWLTVLWAEHRGVKARIRGKAIDPEIIGWVIALGVAVLLFLHGREGGSLGQTIAGPFVVLVGKAVWAFALPALRDPAALHAEQEDEIHDVMRDSLDVIQTPSRHREPAVTSAITDREQPSIGDLAREQVAITPDNAIAIGTICSLRPDAHRPSVAAAVRRARQQLDSRGGYR
jgi:hypothetical protein